MAWTMQLTFVFRSVEPCRAFAAQFEKGEIESPSSTAGATAKTAVRAEGLEPEPGKYLRDGPSVVLRNTGKEPRAAPGPGPLPGSGRHQPRRRPGSPSSRAAERPWCSPSSTCGSSGRTRSVRWQRPSRPSIGRCGSPEPGGGAWRGGLHRLPPRRRTASVRPAGSRLRPALPRSHAPLRDHILLKQGRGRSSTRERFIVCPHNLSLVSTFFAVH